MYQAPQILPDLKRGEDSEWDDQPKRGGVRKVLGAAAAVVLVLGGGCLAWANRESFGSFGGRGKPSAVVATNSSAELGKRGDWPGMPDAATVFPGYMDIGYIRVYKRK